MVVGTSDDVAADVVVVTVDVVGLDVDVVVVVGADVEPDSSLFINVNYFNFECDVYFSWQRACVSMKSS